MRPGTTATWPLMASALHMDVLVSGCLMVVVGPSMEMILKHLRSFSRPLKGRTRTATFTLSAMVANTYGHPRCAQDSPQRASWGEWDYHSAVTTTVTITHRKGLVLASTQCGATNKCSGGPRHSHSRPGETRNRATCPDCALLVLSTDQRKIWRALSSDHYEMIDHPKVGHHTTRSPESVPHTLTNAHTHTRARFHLAFNWYVNAVCCDVLLLLPVCVDDLISYLEHRH